MRTKKNFTSRVLDALTANDAVRVNQGKYVRMTKRFKALESVQYSEYDLRGLSAQEKAFMRENEYKCYVDHRECSGGVVKTTRYYLFIARSMTTGRRQLYAYSKKQYLNLNGHDISSDHYNYECWLTVRFRNGEFNEISKYNYERRFCQMLAVVAID